jgi:hypothetical protein
MLRRITLLVFSFACATTATAASREDACNLETPWAVELQSDALVFSRKAEDAGTPRAVRVADGSLSIDGRDIVLSRDDRRRLQAYESEVRALIPEVKEIALDAINIAFTAVDEVARMFAGKDDAGYERTAEKLATARIAMRRKVDDAFKGRGWSDDDFDAVVEEAVAQLLPTLIGDIVGTAVRVALSGDEAAARELEARAERMEREIETRVEARAEAIEARAEALCPRLVALDRIEAEVTAELAPGQRFDLITVGE